MDAFLEMFEPSVVEDYSFEEDTELQDMLEGKSAKDDELPKGMNEYGHENLSSYHDVFAEAWQAFRAKPPMNFPDWADEHYYLAPGSSGMAGNWVTAPYQRGIMLMMGHDSVREVTLQKPARVGFTKALSAFVVYNVERKGRSTCLWQPTKEDSDEFVQDEIDPLFEYVPVFADALIVDPTVDKDPRNTNTRKVFNTGATARFKPGKSAKNYRRITVDVAMLDELDGFDHNIRGTDGKFEGSPVKLAGARTTQSPFRKLIKGSTPTIKDSSLIEAEMRNCEVVLERYVRCVNPECHEFQKLEWGAPDLEHGMKWSKKGTDQERSDTAVYRCKNPECQYDHTWAELNEMDKHGYWATDEMYLDDSGDGKFYHLHNDTPAKMPRNIGFTFSTMLSPFFSWGEMLLEFLEACKAAKMGDNTKLQAFYNTRLGQCYEIFTAQQLDPDLFMERREVYPAQIPLPVTHTTCAVDVQVNRLVVDKKGWGAGEECWSVRNFVILGDTSVYPELDENGNRKPGQPETVWCRLHNMMQQADTHESGRPMKPSMVVIDSGYNATQVYHFCRRSPWTYIAVKGQGGGASVPMVNFPRKPNNFGVFVAELGTDNMQNALISRLQITEDGPGKWHWPLRNDPNAPEDVEPVREDYDLAYFTEMTVEKPVRRYVKGRAYMTWECPENTANEATDTCRYSLAAVKILQDFGGVTIGDSVVTYEMPDGTMSDIPIPVGVVDFSDAATALNQPSQP